MILWAVIDRRHLRHSTPISSSLRMAPALCPKFRDSFLPSSVPSSKFRIPQLLCLPLLRKHPGCVPTIPEMELSTQHLPRSLKFFLFKFLRTLLRVFALAKNSTLLFSSDSALFAKKHGGWGAGYG